MKRFTLLLVAAMMTLVSFAQAPKGQAVNKPITKEMMKQMRHQQPDASLLSAAQKQHTVGMVQNGKMKLNAKTATKSTMKVNNKLAQQVTGKQVKFNGRQFDAQKMTSMKDRMKAKRASMKNGAVAPRKVGGTTLVEAPEGLETETYQASGFSFMDYAQVNFDVEVGMDGNDMYIKGLFRLTPDAWIKGVKNGNTITFAKDQFMGEAEIMDMYSGESMGMFPVWLEYTTDFESYCDIVLTVNPDNGVIDDAQGGILAFALNDDLDVADAFQYLRLTPGGAIDDADHQLVTPPAYAQQWGVDISSFSISMDKQQSNTGLMAIDGNDFYVQGLCPNVGGWVKGTLGGDNKVTFPMGQFVGTFMGVYDIWFMATDPTGEEANLRDAVATWNADERTLTFDEDSWIVENANPVAMFYLDVYSDVFVEPMADDRTLVIPPAGLETKTYNTTVASLGHYEYANGSYDVNIGFDGDDAYMQGLLFFAPSAWIKGTRNADGSLTFAKNQYIGTVQGYDVYVVPCSDEYEDIPAEIYDSFTFTYDAEKDTYYYIEQNTNISFSVAPESTDAVEIVFNVVMKGPDAPEEEEINTDVIYEQPEGELKVYTRAGGAYYTFWGYLVDTVQGGTSIKVVTNGNDVYMENPISQAPVEGGTWVKGTLEGNKIHMPLKQCVLYDEWSGYGYMTATFRLGTVYDEWSDQEIFTYVMTDDTEVTFTINEDGTITMDQTSEIDPEYGLADFIYGLAYTDDKAWGEFGDYNSVYTLFDEEITLLPEGVETETWAFMFEDEYDYSSARTVNVAIDGDKMYIEGMSEFQPEAVMVGTIDGDKVTFASDQFLGEAYSYLGYGVFANVSTELIYDEVYEEEYEALVFEYLPEYSFKYDAADKTLTSGEGVAFIVNAGKGADDILYISMAKKPRLNYFEEIPATPADPEFLDYSEWFDGYGYDIVTCNIKLEDVNGKYINQDKVFYTLWVKIDGEAEQFVFDSYDYVGFEELGISEMVEVPVNFEVLDAEGYQDIAAGASGICIYQTGFDDFGIQTIYYGGDERRTSNIVWWNGGEANSIKDVNAGSENLIYDLQGRKLQKLQKGVNIIRKDGKTFKAVIK